MGETAEGKDPKEYLKDPNMLEVVIIPTKAKTLEKPRSPVQMKSPVKMKRQEKKTKKEEEEKKRKMTDKLKATRKTSRLRA